MFKALRHLRERILSSGVCIEFLALFVCCGYLAGGRLPQSNCEDTAAKHNQTGKPKRISSSSGFGRIGSFFTRSFSKHRSRSNRHSKDESPPSATELEATEAPRKHPHCCCYFSSSLVASGHGGQFFALLLAQNVFTFPSFVD